MADDRLPCCRWKSIAATKSDNVMWRSPPISFRLFQNPSSRLTLVLWPPTTTERLVTRDFIKTHLLFVENSQHPNTKFVPFCGHLKESRSVAKITLKSGHPRKDRDGTLHFARLKVNCSFRDFRAIACGEEVVFSLSTRGRRKGGRQAERAGVTPRIARFNFECGNVTQAVADRLQGSATTGAVE